MAVLRWSAIPPICAHCCGNYWDCSCVASYSCACPKAELQGQQINQIPLHGHVPPLYCTVWNKFISFLKETPAYLSILLSIWPTLIMNAPNKQIGLPKFQSLSQVPKYIQVETKTWMILLILGGKTEDWTQWYFTTELPPQPFCVFRLRDRVLLSW